MNFDFRVLIGGLVGLIIGGLIALFGIGYFTNYGFDFGSLIGGISGGIIGGVIALRVVRKSIDHSDKIFKQETKAKKIGHLKYLKTIFGNLREAEYKNVCIFLHLSLLNYSLVDEGDFKSVNYHDLKTTIQLLNLDKEDIVLLSEIDSFNELKKLKYLIETKDRFLLEEFSRGSKESIPYWYFHDDDKIFIPDSNRNELFIKLRETIRDNFPKDRLVYLREQEKESKILLNRNLFSKIFNPSESPPFGILQNLMEIHDTIFDLIKETSDYINTLELNIKKSFHLEMGKLIKNLYNYLGEKGDDRYILKILDDITEKISAEINKLEPTK